MGWRLRICAVPGLTLIRASPVAMFLLRPTNAYRLVNDRRRAIAGLERHEWLGRVRGADG